MWFPIHNPTLATLVRALAVLILFASLTATLAHVPRFPDGEGPFEVEEPTLSQAFYLQLGEGQSHTFVLPPLSEAVPVQLLVLDDELGQSLQLEGLWSCEGVEYSLMQTDQPFYERFSRIHHRYRVVDAVGPTETSCEVTVSEESGLAGPYVFSVGAEERFSARDILGMLTLGDKLEAWQAGR